MNFIRKNGKRFADSNRYQVLVPIDANEAPIEESSIVANEAPIGTSPIDANEAPTFGASNAPPIVANEAPGKTTKKANQRKLTNREISPEGIQFAQWFKSSLPESVNLKANWQQSFAETYDQLVRLDNRDPEQIRVVSRWARTDLFWKSNFMSPSKLRDRDKNGIQWFDVFTEKMKQPSGQSSRPQDAVNTGRRQRPKEYPQEDIDLP